MSTHAAFYWHDKVLYGRVGDATASWPWADHNGEPRFTPVQQMVFAIQWAEGCKAETFEILTGAARHALKSSDGLNRRSQ